MTSFRLLPPLLALGLSLPALPGWAQVAPASGDLLREIERQPAPAVPSVPPAAPAPQPVVNPGGPTVLVKGFRLEGVSLMPLPEVQAVLAPWQDQAANFASLRQAADAVAELYRRRGYLVRASLPDQQVSDGVVLIQVLEGKLAAVRVERSPETRALDDARITALMTARQALGAPVRPDDLQRAITLLNDTPGMSASSVLEPGQRSGDTQLVVVVKDKPRLSGTAQLDNSGSRATGEERLTLSGALNNPGALGDQAQATLNLSERSRYGRLAYSLPLGNDGLRGSAYLSQLSYAYHLGGLRYSGGADVTGVSLSYPWLRQVNRNVTASLALERKGFDNAVAGISLNDKVLKLATASLGGDALDELGGGGLWQYSLGLSTGSVDLGGNPTDLASDQAAGGPGRHGHFERLNWQLSRLQRLGAADSLQIGWSGQRAFGNLDAAEKFQATGPYGVRAYGGSEPSGDTGALLSLELKHQFSAQWSASVFHDHAFVWRDQEVSSGTQAPNRYHLLGSGLGLQWSPVDGTQLRLSSAWRHGRNPARNLATGQDSDGTHREPRVWASVFSSF